MSSRTIIVLGVLIFISVFLVAGNVQQKISFTENDVVGAWVYMSNGVPEDGGEEMDFSIESGVNTFNSYLHNRPEYIGCTWSLEVDTLHILCSNAGNNIDLHILSLDKNALKIESDLYTGTFQKLEK